MLPVAAVAIIATAGPVMAYGMDMSLPMMNSAFAADTPAARRESFAELAIMGTMAATTRLALAANPGHPAAAAIRSNLKAATASYLAVITAKDPARLTISATGLNMGS